MVPRDSQSDVAEHDEDHISRTEHEECPHTDKESMLTIGFTLGFTGTNTAPAMMNAPRQALSTAETMPPTKSPRLTWKTARKSPSIQPFIATRPAA
jgi:hypothetical protein